MAIDIIVIRDPGDRCGEDIIEPLLGSQAAAINRGRNELDDKAHPKTPVRVQSLFRTGVRSGQLAEVHNELEGTVARGKITSIQHTVSGGSAVTEVTVDKVQEGF